MDEREGQPHTREAWASRESLDTSALLRARPKALRGDEAATFATLDKQLAGRAPVVPQQTFREYVVNAPDDVMEARQAFLDEFVENRGGAYGGRVDTPAAQALQAEVEAARSRLRTPTIPKKLGLGDAQVAQAARTEGAPIVTSDKKMADTLSLLKDFVVELFQ